MAITQKVEKLYMKSLNFPVMVGSPIPFGIRFFPLYFQLPQIMLQLLQGRYIPTHCAGYLTSIQNDDTLFSNGTFSIKRTQEITPSKTDQ
jgi:hypothetical protein